MVALRLVLENVDSLPDGGPTSFDVVGRRTIEIGRNTFLDWTLPDPERIVSGRHCEVAFRDGGYVLTDVSANGTFLNGSDIRLSEPHRLRSGDRVAVGPYHIRVTVEEEEPRVAPPADPVRPGFGGRDTFSSLWDVPADPAASSAPPARVAAAARPVHADMLDWIADVPTVAPAATPAEAKTAVESPSGGPSPARSANSDEAMLRFAAEPTDPEPTDPGPSSESEPGRPGDMSDPKSIAAPDPVRSGTSTSHPFAAQPSLLPGPELEPHRDEQLNYSVAHVFPATSDLPRDPTGDVPFSAGDVPFTADPALTRRTLAVPARPTATPTAATDGDAMQRLITALAAELGVADVRLAAHSPETLGRTLGSFMRRGVEGLHGLLRARSVARGFIRSGRGTMVEAIGNNPLKFMPTSAAIDVLIAPHGNAYLDVDATLDDTFRDLTAHHVAVYSAMQTALERMISELSPAAIEAADEGKRGGLLGGSAAKKARHWELYRTRWTARSEPHDRGMVDVFMLYFSDAYERAVRGDDGRRPADTAASR